MFNPSLRSLVLVVKSGLVLSAGNRTFKDGVIVMSQNRLWFSRSGSFLSGVTLALACGFTPVHSARVVDNSWHEMRFILDRGVDAPYFSFRCYHATRGAINA